MELPLEQSRPSNIENEKAVGLILKYINDLKSNKTPSYPLQLKGTEHEKIIKELNSLVQKNEETQNNRENQITNLITKKKEAQNTEKEHIQFMLRAAQNILNPLNGILGFLDILLSSPENLSIEDKEKYLNFIRQGEFALLQNIDHMTAYANIMTSDNPGAGFCRTKQVLKYVLQKANDKTIIKYKRQESIQISQVVQKMDLFLQISENSIKLIWNVLIEFVITLFKKAQITLDIIEDNNGIILKTVVIAEDFVRKEQISSLENFISASGDKTLYKPQIGIPLFVAQKQLALINGEYSLNIKTSKKIVLYINIPNAICAEKE